MAAPPPTRNGPQSVSCTLYVQLTTGLLEGTCRSARPQEWAARWSLFKVTCEPFGKEHATVGGSYDTSKIISKKIFDWEPPEPVVYEFFTLNGEKISSSKGNVITLADWLMIAEPETLKYFMYKRLQKQRDIDLKRIPNLADEYDEVEREFYDKKECKEG